MSDTEKYRSALMWVFDRLSVDGGLNLRQQRKTMAEIGCILADHPTEIANYKPNEWDESAKLIAIVAKVGSP